MEIQNTLSLLDRILHMRAHIFLTAHTLPPAPPTHWMRRIISSMLLSKIRSASQGLRCAGVTCMKWFGGRQLMTRDGHDPFAPPPVLHIILKKCEEAHSGLILMYARHPPPWGVGCFLVLWGPPPPPRVSAHRRRRSNFFCLFIG